MPICLYSPCLYGAVKKEIDIVNNEDSSAESHPDKEGQPDSAQPPFQQRLGDIEGREET